MKTIILTILGFCLLTNTFGQGKITFYTDQNKTPSDKCKCGDYKAIKVKYPSQKIFQNMI